MAVAYMTIGPMLSICVTSVSMVPVSSVSGISPPKPQCRELHNKMQISNRTAYTANSFSDMHFWARIYVFGVKNQLFALKNFQKLKFQDYWAYNNARNVSFFSTKFGGPEEGLSLAFKDVGD